MLTFYTFNEVIYNKKCLIEHIFYAYFYLGGKLLWQQRLYV